MIKSKWIRSSGAKREFSRKDLAQQMGSLCCFVKEPMKLQITNYEERVCISQEAPNLTILLMEALLLRPNLYQNCVTI